MIPSHWLIHDVKPIQENQGIGRAKKNGCHVQLRPPIISNQGTNRYAWKPKPSAEWSDIVLRLVSCASCTHITRLCHKSWLLQVHVWIVAIASNTYHSKRIYSNIYIMRIPIPRKTVFILRQSPDLYREKIARVQVDCGRLPILTWVKTRHTQYM